ncbi:MAG: hypothetical protein COT13_05530 [Chloroflexi bacterium CG08_land_8_20_14_0_20_45_12]|nr:MAG: hypothetical protein COT13_05530 [Chloroflexi bacterium CG08_land_8_20_14_0_20_45_12]
MRWYFSFKKAFPQPTQRFCFERKSTLWDTIRQPHNPKVVGSNPTPATIKANKKQDNHRSYPASYLVLIITASNLIYQILSDRLIRL